MNFSHPKLFISASLLFLFSVAFSQVGDDLVSCGTHSAMEELYHRNPEALQEAREFEEFTKHFSENFQSRARAKNTDYIIPVVFHVFGSDFEGRTVTVELVENALRELSEDFQGLSSVSQNVTNAFLDRQSTLSIDFRLAQIDPSGNVTSGVKFYPTTAGFGNGSGYDAVIQSYAWDNYKYMNVYVMLDLYNNDVTTESGVAWYPNTWMSDNNLARVVYNGKYLGDNTSVNFRRVLTHEFGHYLNLMHTFEGGCTGNGDNVGDTPATTSNSGSCNTTVEKCTGAGPANGENFMDYTNCYRMFTQGQVVRMEAALQHETRRPLWQSENLAATGMYGLGAHLFLNETAFDESIDNDGSVVGSVTINANNGAAFAVTGELVQDEHYTVSGLPSGLGISIEVSDVETASLSFEGQAANHFEFNSTDNVQISFLDAALVDGASSIIGTNIRLSLNFIDPYEFVYEDIDDISVNSLTTWEYFTISVGGHDYGCWYDEGKLRFETYTKEMVCEEGTVNLSFIEMGETIDENLNWVAGGEHPDQHNLRTADYTVWDGKTGFLGFRVPASDGHFIYGWFKVTVTDNANKFTLHDYAFNENPKGSITAGLVSDQPYVLDIGKYQSDDLVYPNPVRDILNIESNANNLKSVRIFNMTGAEVLRQEIERETSKIDLSRLRPGQYIVQLRTSENHKINKKVLKIY